VAVCDVDAGNAEKTKKRVEDHYAKKNDSTYKGCFSTKDFREICSRGGVEAVIVATPDHWHYLAALEAVRNKKDVYGEKPITHTYAEAKHLVAEVKKNQVIWQTGSQQRSEFTFHRGAEIVRNGLIGKVTEVEVGLPQGRSGHKKGDEVVSDPPANVDYDMWCGPAPKLPFMKARFHFHWRWNLAFGGGQLLDWICHHNDIAHWGLDEDLGGPLEIEAQEWAWPEDKTVFDAPYHYKVISKYAKDIKVSICSDNFVKHGCKWIGENGWVISNRGKIEASNPEWLKPDFEPGPVKLYNSRHHQQNFIDCVKSRKPTICPIEVSHHSITPGHLGYLSEKLKRKIKWDPKEEKVLGDDEAMKILNTATFREPWKFPA
ncbi:MAG TPA: Gfo/Idh/MocA family oxidoreductase, partial [Planctomycetota bacterium]|nr:Gfo/Idh/MocA family oxidoreductase [Planctomycetota bacterium]